MVRYIRELQEQGDKAQATNVLLRTLAASTKPVESNVTELTKAWRDLENVLYDTGQNSKSVVLLMGEAIDHVAATALNGITRIIEALKVAYNWIDAHTPPWLKSAVSMLNAGAGNPFAGPLSFFGGMPGINPFGGNQFGATPWSTMPGGSAPSGQEVIRDRSGAPGVGMFMLQPDAARDVGLTDAQRYDYNLNIKGGLSYFRQQFEATRDVDTATRAYNAGLAGANAGKGFDYLQSVKQQDPNRLPPDVKRDIEDAFYKLYADIARTAAGPEVLRRIEQIAMQESGGRHFVASAGAPGAAAALPPGGAAPGPYGPAVPEDFGGRNRLNDEIERGRQLYEELNTVNRQLEENRLKIIQASRALQAAVTRANEAQRLGDQETLKQAQRDVAEQTETLKRLQGQRTDILTPAQRAAREAYEATIPLQAEPGAAREFAQLREQQRQRARQYGEDDPEANARERTALQTRLTAAANDNIRTIDLQVQAEQRLIPAYELGGQAAQHLLNHERALIEARQYAERGTAEYTAIVDKLTEAYDRQSMTAPDRQAAESIARMRQETEQLDLQLKLLTATNVERERQMAMLQQRQALGLAPGATPDEEQQKAIDQAGDVAGHRARNQEVLGAYREIEQTAGRIGDTLEKALTEPLKEGETAAHRFGSVMVSILGDIEKELLKLAVINPLLNALFGGEHRPEMGDLGGAGQGGGLLGKGLGGIGSVLSAWLGGGSSAGTGIGVNASLYSSADAVGPFMSEAPAAVAHGGGLVGQIGSHRFVSPGLFWNAPRFHAGLGADEFATILQRGERVLTAGQQRQMAAAANDRGRRGGHSFTFNFPSTTSPDGFRRAGSQVASQVSATLARTQARNA
jgi:hypothetical protein